MLSRTSLGSSLTHGPKLGHRGNWTRARIFTSAACALVCLGVAVAFLPRACTEHRSLRAPALGPDDAVVRDDLATLKSLADKFQVVDDRVVYSRYARMYSRRVKYPDGKLVDFDVLGRVWKNDSFTVVVTVPFDPEDATFTLVREYNPAHNMHVYSFPQGCMEPRKHRNAADAALAELEEEARISCEASGMTALLDTNLGAPQDKYQRESVHYFLCTKPTAVPKVHERHRDAEENIDVQTHIGVEKLQGLIRAGVLQSNNIAAGLLAIDRLRELGMLS